MKLNRELALVVSKVFNVPVEDLSLNTSPDDIDAWDSLGHLNLIMSIEEKFKVRFKAEDIAKFETLGEIQQKLEEMGVL